MKNIHGNNLLHTAALEGHSDCCLLLLHYQPDIKAQNNFGQTFLDIAFQFGQKDKQQLLSEHRSGQSHDKQIVSALVLVSSFTTKNPTSSTHNS